MSDLVERNRMLHGTYPCMSWLRNWFLERCLQPPFFVERKQTIVVQHFNEIGFGVDRKKSRSGLTENIKMGETICSVNIPPRCGRMIISNVVCFYCYISLFLLHIWNNNGFSIFDQQSRETDHYNSHTNRVSILNTRIRTDTSIYIRSTSAPCLNMTVQLGQVIITIRINNQLVSTKPVTSRLLHPRKSWYNNYEPYKFVCLSERCDVGKSSAGKRMLNHTISCRVCNCLNKVNTGQFTSSTAYSKWAVQRRK